MESLFIPGPVGPDPTYEQAFGKGPNHKTAEGLEEAQTRKTALQEQLTEADDQISALDAAERQDQQTLRVMLERESGLRTEAAGMRTHQCCETADNPVTDTHLLGQQYRGLLDQLSLVSDTCVLLRDERIPDKQEGLLLGDLWKRQIKAAIADSECAIDQASIDLATCGLAADQGNLVVQGAKQAYLASEATNAHYAVRIAEQGLREFREGRAKHDAACKATGTITRATIGGF